ncbi:hypothetical protein FKP32DRAFT_48856 [Trametes sanguinea]|nr:hypothetical protein FKP32DRAFT_48856 [Trametes sanguinea]
MPSETSRPAPRLALLIRCAAPPPSTHLHEADEAARDPLRLSNQRAGHQQASVGILRYGSDVDISSLVLPIRIPPVRLYEGGHGFAHSHAGVAPLHLACHICARLLPGRTSDVEG